MWVDIDDLRSEIRRLARETEEEFAGRRNCKTLAYGMLVGYHKVEVMLDEMKKDESNEKQYCEWIKYDSWTICPKCHDANNPYWRIPENTDKLKYCPYCGKKITIVKGE